MAQESLIELCARLSTARAQRAVDEVIRERREEDRREALRRRRDAERARRLEDAATVVRWALGVDRASRRVLAEALGAEELVLWRHLDPKRPFGHQLCDEELGLALDGEPAVLARTRIGMTRYRTERLVSAEVIADELSTSLLARAAAQIRAGLGDWLIEEKLEERLRAVEEE